MNFSNGTDARTQDVIACLAVPSRFHLVRVIAGEDLCVGELALRVGLSQSCTTRHLQALERAGLVERRREGRRVRYRLHPEAGASRSLLDVVLGGALPQPVPVAVPARARRGVRGAPARPIGRGKSLPKGTLRGADDVGAGDRDVVRGESAEPRNAEMPTGDGQPIRTYRRQDIEDYLL